MKRIFTLLLAVILCITPVTDLKAANFTSAAMPGAKAAPTIYSEAAVVMDAATGQLLYEKNPNESLYPASITKILTTLVALENSDLSATFAMSEAAVNGIESDCANISLRIGEEISVEDALYGIMLASANEAALGLAEYVSGSVDGFCALMNQKANSLGCTGSNFVNPNGLTQDGMCTTAYDMALITKAAIENEDFVTIATASSHTIAPTNMTSTERPLTQGNRLVKEDSEFYYESCIGGKTGYTQAAGGTLVSWAKKDDRTLICVTMLATDNTQNYQDHIALYDYCFDNFTVLAPLSDFVFTAEELTAAENYLNTVYGGKNMSTIRLLIDTSQTVIAPASMTNADFLIEIIFDSENVSRDLIGNVRVSAGNHEYLSVPITYTGYINSNDTVALEEAYSNGTLERPKKKASVGKILLILVILVIIAGGAFVYLRMQYLQQMRNRKTKKQDDSDLE